MEDNVEAVWNFLKPMQPPPSAACSEEESAPVAIEVSEPEYHIRSYGRPDNVKLVLGILVVKRDGKNFFTLRCQLCGGPR